MGPSHHPDGIGACGKVDGAVIRLGFKNRDERGSAAVEAAVGVPAFLLLVGFIIFGGRTAMTHSAVESAAADAARSASIARTATQATSDATTAAQTSLANQGIHCIRVTVNVDTTTFHAPVGNPGSVRATVGCLLDLSDLSVPGVPGTHLVTASISSPLDTWRERSP